MSKISRDEKKTKDGYYFDNKNSNKRIVHIGVNEDSEYLQDDLKVK
jgi:hypothetical protein